MEQLVHVNRIKMNENTADIYAFNRDLLIRMYNKHLPAFALKCSFSLGILFSIFLLCTVDVDLQKLYWQKKVLLLDK